MVTPVTPDYSPLVVEDVLPVIKPLTMVLGDVQRDVTTRTGIELTPEMRLQQADYSYSRKTFGQPMLEHLPHFYPETWERELNNPTPSRQTRYIVGMIELVTGMLQMMKQQGTYVPLLIITPETGLHPNHQCTMMEFLTSQMKSHNDPNHP